MNRKRYILAGVWLVLFVLTSAIVFGGGRNDRFGYWQGWGNMPGWGMMHDRGGNTPWRGHHFWQDEEDDWPDWHDRLGMWKGFGWHYRFGDEFLQSQNLTQEQREKLRQLLADSEQVKRKLLQQRKEVHEKLVQLYTSDTRDWKAIRETTHELMEVKSKLLDVAIDLQQKVDAEAAGKPERS